MLYSRCIKTPELYGSGADYQQSDILSPKGREHPKLFQAYLEKYTFCFDA